MARKETKGETGLRKDNGFLALNGASCSPRMMRDTDGRDYLNDRGGNYHGQS